MDIHNSIMDIHNLIMDIHNCMKGNSWKCNVVMGSHNAIINIVSSTILAASISYLHILPTNFRRCVERSVVFKIWILAIS